MTDGSDNHAGVTRQHTLAQFEHSIDGMEM